MEHISHDIFWKMLQVHTSKQNTLRQKAKGSKILSLLIKTMHGNKACQQEGMQFCIDLTTFRKLRSWHLVWSLHGKKMGNNGNSDWLYFWGLQNHWRWWLQLWNLKMLTHWKESYDQPRQHIKKQRHSLCQQMSL